MCALAKKNSHCPASICNGCLCVCLCVCVSNAVNNGKETRKSTFCARCHRPNRTAADTLNFAVNCFQNRYCRCDPWACGVCVWERRRVSRNGYGDIIIIIIFYYAASGRTHTFRAFFFLLILPSIGSRRDLSAACNAKCILVYSHFGSLFVRRQRSPSLFWPTICKPQNNWFAVYAFEMKR